MLATGLVWLPMLLWYAAFRPGLMSADSLVIYEMAKHGLWLDLQLLLGTAVYAVGASYTLIGKLIGLPNSETVERAYRDLSLKRVQLGQADSGVTSQAGSVVDVEMVPCTSWILRCASMNSRALTGKVT